MATTAKTPEMIKVVDVDLPDEIFDVETNIPLIHQVVTAQLAAARQGTHSTKTRAEVRGGGRKPYRQKGTGRARQGSIRAPQFAGGGIVHGPQPRDYSQRTPKKMKAAALRGALSDRARHGRIHVVDVGEGAWPAVTLAGEDVRASTVVSRNLEQLVLGTGGVFENPAARRALAACVPRTALFDELGASGDGGAEGPVSSRLLPPDSPLYPQTAGAAERYAGTDLEAARSEREASGQDGIRVRIGYLGPDDRRARAVAVMAESCAEAGIEIVDAASESFTPSLLAAGEVDAVLAGTASAAGAGGTADMHFAREALHSGAGSNVGNFRNGRVDEILDALLVARDNAAVAGLVVEAEQILWTEIPTIPLFSQPRTIAFAAGLRAGVPNPTTAGTGWNMDRWILTG